MRIRRGGPLVATMLSVALILAGCGGDDGDSAQSGIGHH